MKPHDQPHGLCSVDPISLTGLALAGAGGLFAGKELAPQAPPPPAAPPAPAAAAPPAQQPGVKASAPSQQPTFLGGAAVPQQSGAKSLLGQ